MGTWGECNFDNDGALDYLGGIIDQLTNHIEGLFKKGSYADLDECGESELIPSVHIIALLVEQCNGVPPELNMILSWKKKYLALFNKQIDDLADEEFKNARREVIIKTFEKLEQFSSEFWSE